MRCVALVSAATFALATLPTGRVAPVVIPKAPKPYWSWDHIPTSFHGAVKDRTFTNAEVARLAKYQMATIEKWYRGFTAKQLAEWQLCPGNPCLSSAASFALFLFGVS